ncbi:hypothetical protein M8994_13730 [Brucella sp. 21LCYQ03]|nr:hypothetical protein [Brucella sp. 21LCYQ03]
MSNPTNGDKLAEITLVTEQDLDQVMIAARSAFGKWSTLLVTVSPRRAIR